MLSVVALAPAAMAQQGPPPGVQPLYAQQHGAWQVACSRVLADKQVFCNIAQAQPYEGNNALILGVQVRRDGEYVFFFLPAGLQKDSNVTFLTDKKEAGELKQVDGKALRILPDLSQTHIKQFMAGNTLVVQFVPNGQAQKKFVRFNLGGFTASITDARAQLKAAQ
jgi:invasion protein IalB